MFSRALAHFAFKKNVRNLTTQVVKNTNPSSTRRSFSKSVLLTAGGLSAVSATSFLVYYAAVLDRKEKRRVRVKFESVGRALRSFFVAGQIAADYKWNLWGVEEDGEQAQLYADTIKECHLRSAQRIVAACIQNAGLYVKMGQGLSTMNHILPREYYETLRKLQSEALRATGADIDELFLEEFGKTPDEMFDSFEREPIAAASLAQVHRATVKGGKEGSKDEKLAVKLQYIDLQDRFVGDIFTVKLILAGVGLAFPKFDFAWVLDELRDTLEKELDFVNEANNSKRCMRELAHLGFVYVPRVYDNLSTKRILCMEFIDGFKVSDVEGMKKAGLSIKDVDQKLIVAFAEQIFHTGFVHADPHHGNIFVRPLNKNSKSSSKAEIVLIDHGLYDFIGDKDRRNLCKLWTNIILKDEAKMRFYSKQLNVDEYMLFSSFLTMRPLHRPIHSKLVFNSDWLQMSDAEKTRALDAGKKRIPTPKEYKSMSNQERQDMRAEFKPFFEDMKDEALKVFRSFPPSLMLVCRNLNTVRSIIHDHGNLVDRHTIMARIAISGAYKNELQIGVKQKVKSWFELRFFDLILAWDSFVRWSTAVYLYALVKLGKMDAEMLQEIVSRANIHVDNSA